MKSVWSFLISLKLTIFTLIIICIASIFGTVIPQKELPAVYLRAYKPSTYELIRLLNLDNMYESWWFLSLLTLFTLNLICCTINRVPGFLRLMTRAEKEPDDQLMRTLPLKKTLRLKAFDEATRNLLTRSVHKHLKNSTAFQSTPERFSLFAESGKYTRTSFYITHLGIVLILIGGIVGNLGYQGYMQVVEGKTNDTIQLRGSTQQKVLDFAIRCDDFEVTFYEGSQRPKAFTSRLTIIDGGSEVKQKSIVVNDPLTYKGVTIYQSSYGYAPDQGQAVLEVVPASGAGQAKRYTIGVGDRLPLGDEGYELAVRRFVPDFSMGQSGEVVSRSQEPKNPAVQIALIKDGAPLEEKWIFANYPDFHGAQKGPYKFTFLNFSAREYTGLQLTRDPGVWVVWAGCFLLCLGCYLLCFSSHKRLWLSVAPKNGEYLLTLAGTSNKNMVSFTKTFERLYLELKQAAKA